MMRTEHQAQINASTCQRLAGQHMGKSLGHGGESTVARQRTSCGRQAHVVIHLCCHIDAGPVGRVSDIPILTGTQLLYSSVAPAQVFPHRGIPRCRSSLLRCFVYQPDRTEGALDVEPLEVLSSVPSTMQARLASATKCVEWMRSNMQQ